MIRGGIVHDGSRRKPQAGFVSIKDGIIASVGSSPLGNGFSADRVIEADGAVVAPGFIDTHTHSDALPFLLGDHDDLRLGSVRQGVTTEIAGNCGFSLYPVTVGSDVVGTHIATLFGPDITVYPNLLSYADAATKGEMAANLATLVGHGTVRATVVGFDDRPAETNELDQMASLVDVALSQGGLGLSTGLIYPPGCSAPTDELVALASVSADHVKPYVSHIRNEMRGVLSALDEALDIGRRSGAAVHVSHLKAGGPPDLGGGPVLVDKLEAARRQGLNVTSDGYPYTKGSTVLRALLPPTASVGGVEAMLGRLASPEGRASVRAGLQESDWQNFLQDRTWSAVTIAYAPATPDFEGKTIDQIARERSVDPIDAACDALIVNQGAVVVVIDLTRKEDVIACLCWDGAMVGSDGIPIPGKPHPRWAGSFSRVLGELVRDRRVLSLNESIHRMTGAAAARFGLGNRGRIADGAAADIVIFDPETVGDRATYAEPLAKPVGVSHVIVNGVPVIDDGVDTGRRPGQFVRKESAATRKR